MDICDFNNCEFKGEDKKKHALVCFGISIFSLVLAIAAALWKEMKDSRQKDNHWCWNDLLADAFGILAGTAVRALLIWLIFL